MPNPISKLLSLGDGKRLRRYRRTVDMINSLEDGLSALEDAELRAMADRLRERAAAGEANEGLLPESFALMREASKRTVGLRHYDVQLIGGIALNDGCVAAVETGEGKTLVSTAVGFLNALSGDPVHVVTVNDYLAKRDAEWVGRIYGLLGMDVGLVQNGMEPADRRPAYAAAVTYGTNSEFGFDYLRDNMASPPREGVQRGHAFAIVDEADSVLIDEARTPLIISGLAGAPSEICNNFAEIAAKLDPEEDIVLDEKRRTVYETEAGLAKIEKMLGAEVYADLTGATANRLRQALKAQFLFKLDHDYVVGIGLRAYGHRDPLVEYKEEAYQAFSRLVDSIYEDGLRAILRLPVESAGAASSGLSEEDDPFRPEGMVYSDSRSAPGAPPLEAPDPAGGNPLG